LAGQPCFNPPTPPRPLTEHHSWTVGGKTYRLVWGDLHRHTDISNYRNFPWHGKLPVKAGVDQIHPPEFH
jgi:hypothetical protein